MLELAQVHDSSCLGVHVIRSINLRIRCGKMSSGYYERPRGDASETEQKQKRKNLSLGTSSAHPRFFNMLIRTQTKKLHKIRYCIEA
uniref:Uncharacterized protein n=1 Tax=Anguilla anguilla TaxID=7936 RepID=A0A0E9SFY9_ANGAN